MSLKHLRSWLVAEGEAADLRHALELIAHHVGGDPARPSTVVQAAQSLRAALSLAKGHRDIPRDDSGAPVAFAVVGR